MVAERFADSDPIAHKTLGSVRGGAPAVVPDDSTRPPPDGDPTLTPAQRTTLAGYAFLAALALGAVESAKALLVARSRGIDFGLDRALATNMSWWLLWVPVALAVFGLARRVPLRCSWPAMAIHGGACVVLSLLHLAASSVIIWQWALVPPGVSHTMASQFRDLLGAYLLMEFVTYGAILASHTVYVSRVRLRATEAERARLRVAAARAEAEQARLENLATRARLRALRSELDPHFLFNSLNSVAALAKKGDTHGTLRMLSRIGDLLRTTLDEHRDILTTVREELQLVRLYLDIEEIRFGNRLTTEIRADPAVRQALVPTLILQPLVENAMQHGASAVSGVVSVVVEVRARGDQLRMTVLDSGPGPGRPDTWRKPKAVGLRNVRERLDAIGASPGAFVLRARSGGGTEASITLPLRLPESVEITT